MLTEDKAIEELRTLIDDKLGIDLKDAYFLLKKCMEDYWQEILEQEEEELEKEEAEEDEAPEEENDESEKDDIMEGTEVYADDEELDEDGDYKDN